MGRGWGGVPNLPHTRMMEGLVTPSFSSIYPENSWSVRSWSRRGQSNVFGGHNFKENIFCVRCLWSFVVVVRTVCSHVISYNFEAHKACNFMCSRSTRVGTHSFRGISIKKKRPPQKMQKVFPQKSYPYSLSSPTYVADGVNWSGK